MNRTAVRRMAAVEERHWWYRGMRRTAQALLGPVDCDAVLDVGCGTGGWLMRLEPRVAIGLDVQPYAAYLAGRRLPGRIVRASVTSLPFRDGAFDATTSIDVLYHEGVPSDVAALREMVRVTRHGGRVLVQVPAYDWLRSRHDAEVATRERYTRGRLTARMRAAGLRPVRATYANSVLAPVAIAWRLLERALPTGAAADLRVPPEPINAVAELVLAVERAFVRRVGLPFGLSVVALARRDGPSEEIP